MIRNVWRRVAFIVCLLVLIAPSHMIGIDKFVTYDEPWWVISGSNYYYALTHKDFANTIYDYHPAVTTTWMVTAGMLSYFPEYRGLGQGYFDVRKPLFEDFMRGHDKDVISLVRNSRLIQTACLLAMLVLSFYLLQMLVDRKVAFLAIALASISPFYLGISRLLNHEGLLATFVLVSVLAMQVYINRDRRLIFLLISGVAFGLAQLTKSSSIVVVPMIGLMLFVEFFKRDGVSFGERVMFITRSLLIWFGVAGLIYLAVWPGMWVAPGKMLYEVYGNAFSYAFQGARLDVAQELQPSRFGLGNVISSSMFFIGTWAASSTLVTWLGVGVAFPFLFVKNKDVLQITVKSTVIYLMAIAILFILMFGAAQGRNAPYYILSSFVALDVVAGIGWGNFLIWSQKKITWLSDGYIHSTLILMIIGFQIASGLSNYPYYINYKNPLLVKPAAYGYGIGLDQAAMYLAAKPNASQTIAYVYSGMGTFSYFYPGETRVFKKAYLLYDDLSSVARDMLASDYLVVYSAVQDREAESRKFLNVMNGIKPEKIIYIDGLEYVRIYKISDIPASVYEELNK